jgi:hypothetical protein
VVGPVRGTLDKCQQQPFTPAKTTCSFPPCHQQLLLLRTQSGQEAGVNHRAVVVPGIDWPVPRGTSGDEETFLRIPEVLCFLETGLEG